MCLLLLDMSSRRALHERQSRWRRQAPVTDSEQSREPAVALVVLCSAMCCGRRWAGSGAGERLCHG